MTFERRRELRRKYRRAIKGANQQETQHQWLILLAAFYHEDDDYRFFMDIRSRFRSNGASLDDEYLRGNITARQLVRRLKTRVAEAYALALNRYGVAEIDVETPKFRAIIRKLGPEILQAFEGVDPDDSTLFCLAMAKTWHRAVQLIHDAYGLPPIRRLRRKLNEESDAETTILDGDDFETTMTPRQRTDWEAVIG